MSEAGPEPSGEWQRLHPLSPLLRGGVVLLAVLGYLASRLFDSFLSQLGLGGVIQGADEPPGGDGEDPFSQAVAHPLLALAALALFLAVVAGVNWVSWRFSRFRVGGGQVELRSGMLFRQHRQVPLERVQAVELSRPLLARAIGLARVVVQSAGGSDSTLSLSFLELGRAEALREHLLDLAGRTDEAALRPDLPPGAGPGPLPTGPLPPEAIWRPGAVLRPVLEVPNGRLFVATILHSSTIVLGSLVVLGLVGVGVESVGPLALAGIPALLPVAIGIAVNRVKELLTHGNFHLADAGTGVRVQEGLTDLRATTIPLHRIQALELVQPLWWRPVGWWRIRVNVAGSGHGSGEREGQHETTLLPVGTLADARTVLGLVAPGVPPQAWDAAVLGDGSDPGWRGQTRRARWLDPLSWRRNGWADLTTVVLVRTGRLTRRAVAVPHARIQSLAVRQGWLEGRLGVATVHVVPAPGPVTPVLAHLDVVHAEGFLAEVSERARTARRRSGHPSPSLAPDPPGLVDWSRHPQGTPEPERP